MARHLVVGGDGLIGRAVRDVLERREEEVHFTTRRPGASATAVQLDLAAPDCSVERMPGLLRLFDGEPPVVYLAAAISGYAQCEADPTATRRVNVDNLVRIASELVRRGGFVVFPSSSAVFSGARAIHTETDPTEPVSEYGRQKAEAEARLSTLAAGAAGGSGLAVVRLTKVVASGTGVTAAWIGALSAGRSIEAARDLRLAPISLPYAARNLVELGTARRSGTFHLSGEREMAYADLARLLAAGLGAGMDKVVAVDIRERLGGGALPQVGLLDMSATTARTGIRPQPAVEVVPDLLGAGAFRVGENGLRTG